MTNSDNIKKKAMIEALIKSLGVVTTACKDVDIARQTHYRWLQEDEDYKKEVDAIGDMTIDFAESKLHEQINKGDTTSIIFFLKTKGKKRGYIERQEIEHTGIVLRFDKDDAAL
jgi:isopentenyldiphosphate isomerase